MMSSASSTAARWPGTTRSSTAGEPCSYCLAGNGRATPERWSRCWKAWTASWPCGTAERSSPARRLHPTQAFCEAVNGSSSHRALRHRGLNGLGRRWEATLAAIDAGMDASRWRQQWPGQSSQGLCHVNKEAHSTSDCKVERCSEGQAQRAVNSRGRSRAGHTSGHG